MSEIIINNKKTEGKVTFDGESLFVNSQGQDHKFKIQNIEYGETYVSFKVEGQSQTIIKVNTANGSEYLINGHRLIAKTETNKKGTGHHGLSDQVLSPMPGKVIKIYVNKGDKVKKGQPLLALEAMKMEHTLKAPFDGTVADILSQVGEMVQGEFEIIKLTPQK